MKKILLIGTEKLGDKDQEVCEAVLKSADGQFDEVVLVLNYPSSEAMKMHEYYHMAENFEETLLTTLYLGKKQPYEEASVINFGIEWILSKYKNDDFLFCLAGDDCILPENYTEKIMEQIGDRLDKVINPRIAFVTYEEWKRGELREHGHGGKKILRQVWKAMKPENHVNALIGFVWKKELQMRYDTKYNGEWGQTDTDFALNLIANGYEIHPNFDLVVNHVFTGHKKENHNTGMSHAERLETIKSYQYFKEKWGNWVKLLEGDPPATIGVTMKFWNEIGFLPMWLEAINDMDVDIVHLWDDGSTDGSVEYIIEWIAQHSRPDLKITLFKTGTPPHEEYFVQGASEGAIINKQIEAMEKAKVDWLVKLDADELLTTEMNDFFEALKSNNKKMYSHYFLPTANMISYNEYIVHSNVIQHDYYPDYHLRVMNLRRNKFRHPENTQLDTILTPKRHGISETLGIDHAIIHLHFLFPNRRSKRFATRDDDDGLKHKYYKSGTYQHIAEDLLPEAYKKWYTSIKNSDIW